MAMSSARGDGVVGPAGASLTGVTVIVTVAMLELSVPSLARYVKVSVPKKFGLGV